MAKARNETLRATKRYGRAFWKNWTEYHTRSYAYHTRSYVEARIQCLKSFDERITAQDPDRQTAQIHICIALVNHSTPSALPKSSAWHNV